MPRDNTRKGSLNRTVQDGFWNAKGRHVPGILVSRCLKGWFKHLIRTMTGLIYGSRLGEGEFMEL